jgi:hypothetical protein
MTMAPLSVCDGSSLTFILPYLESQSEPAIWGIPPLAAPPFSDCLGLPFDAGNKGLPAGRTLCVAVVATDKVGNRNVSEPLRICMEKKPGDCANRNVNGDPCRASCKSGVVYNNGTQVPAFPDVDIVYVEH